jgi:uncharacterized iron-regulated membrane protein
MEPISLLATTIASIVGTGGVALFFRELIWLRHCRYLHDQAVARGQDPDPAQLIQAARGGRRTQAAERVQQAITGKPPEKN